MMIDKVRLLSSSITDKVTVSEARLLKAKKLRKVGPEAEQLLENQIQILHWVQNMVDTILGDVDADDTETGDTETSIPAEETGPPLPKGIGCIISTTSIIP